MSYQKSSYSNYSNKPMYPHSSNKDQTLAGPPDVDLHFRPLEFQVEGSNRDDFEYSMKKFKVIFQKEGVLGFLKAKVGFEKPSDKKRRKIRDAENRRRIDAERERLIASGEWDKIQKDKIARKMQKEDKKAKERLEESQ
jgi:ribosomal protein S21